MSESLLDLLALALPYVEEAETDPSYKPGAVKRLSARIRAAVERCTLCQGKGTVNFEQACGWDEPCPRCSTPEKGTPP